MRINRQNYEVFLVDFAEGTLSADLVQEVRKFLLLNPDIQEEFDMFSESILETGNVSYLDKEALKKIPGEQTTADSPYFQQLCVAKVEGLLPKGETVFLKQMVASDVLKKQELEWFEKTKLIIEQFNFNEKLTLKQNEIFHEVNHSNFEEYCIACMEGWLDQKGLVALNDYIAANPNQKQVIDVFYKTRLKPDLSIVYPDKRKIKRFTILTPTVKKYSSMIASAAAILVLGFMIFYTTIVDDSAQMANSAITKTQNKPEVNKRENFEHISSVQNNKSEQIKTILRDPFGYEKLSGNYSPVKQAERISMNRLSRIELNEIHCAPCKDVFDNRTLIELNAMEVKKDESSYQLADNSNNKYNKKPSEQVIELAQVGLQELGKITNTELKVEKNKLGNKTRIAFNSRFFSFSTQVNNKSN